MKNSIVGFMLVAILMGCEQPEDYKKVRDGVIQFHDVVMADHAHIIGNQLKLDTLQRNLAMLKSSQPELDTTALKTEIAAIIQRLSRAEASMNNWMLKFEPDASDKSNVAAVAYFKKEMTKIAEIDSVYRKEIKASDAFLKKLKKR